MFLISLKQECSKFVPMSTQKNKKRTANELTFSYVNNIIHLMTKDYTFLIRPLTDFADREILEQYSPDVDPALIARAVSTLKRGGSKTGTQLSFMGEILTCEISGKGNDRKIEQKRPLGFKEGYSYKSFAGTKSISIFETICEAHGWKIGELAHLENLIAAQSPAEKLAILASPELGDTIELSLSYKDIFNASQKDLSAIGLSKQQVEDAFASLSPQQIYDIAVTAALANKSGNQLKLDNGNPTPNIDDTIC